MIPSLAGDGTALPLPEFRMDQAGWYREWLAMDPATRGSMRTYTVRQERLDAVYPEIDVDFVMHFDAAGNGGPAANWALTPSPGIRSPSSDPTTGPPTASPPRPTPASNGGPAWPSACCSPATKPRFPPSAPSSKASRPT